MNQPYSSIFCIWILGFLANCFEIQSNQPRDFLPPYHTFPPHRWEITTSLQTDDMKLNVVDKSWQVQELLQPRT